jgi:ubiquinol-cytochrome c reductase iron-sulfur subunit
MAGSDSYAYDPFSGKDQVKNGGRLEPGDPSRRAFTYFMVGSARFVYASMARLAVIKFVHYMNASADVLALASIEVPVENIPSGGCIVVKWRGKPVFIKKRTEEELQDVASVDWKSLRDPQSDKARRIKEEILVVLGVCTHLGCVPISNAGEFKGGWFCPCHGSHYDASARIRKGPAPLNLEVPPYEFIDGDAKVKIG